MCCQSLYSAVMVNTKLDYCLRRYSCPGHHSFSMIKSTRCLDFCGYHENPHPIIVQCERIFVLLKPYTPFNENVAWSRVLSCSQLFPLKLDINMDIQIFYTREKNTSGMKKTYKKGSIISFHAQSNDHAIDFVNASIIVKGNFRVQ